MSALQELTTLGMKSQCQMRNAIVSETSNALLKIIGADCTSVVMDILYNGPQYIPDKSIERFSGSHTTEIRGITLTVALEWPECNHEWCDLGPTANFSISTPWNGDCEEMYWQWTSVWKYVLYGYDAATETIVGGLIENSLIYVEGCEDISRDEYHSRAHALITNICRQITSSMDP